MPPVNRGLPLLEVGGSPREAGRGHGAGVREAIAENLALYFRRFRDEGPSPSRAEERRSTHLRQEKLAARLAQAAERGPISSEDVEEALRDHEGYPDSVCRHEGPLSPPDLDYQTALSVVLDPRARRLRSTPGPPCRSAYQALGI